VIGKASFDAKKLAEVPSSLKGRYPKKVTVFTATGPVIPVDPGRHSQLRRGA
jgi:ribosomal protein L1